MSTFKNIFTPWSSKGFGSPFYAVSLLKGPKHTAQKDPLPFQAENVATNQQGIPLPYVRGTQVVAVRWVSPALDEITHQVPKNGKKG